MSRSDYRTHAFVVKRTNYGEADRILKLITPSGSQSVIAKSVRKEKSRLAGGIELFCVSDVVIHPGKSDLGILTSAKMLKFYQNITTDLTKLTLASEIIRKISKLSDQITSPELFNVLKESLEYLNTSSNLKIVEFWAAVNLYRISGETLNLHFDSLGNKLSADQAYVWDPSELALNPHRSGSIRAEHIKLLRLSLVSSLNVISNISGAQQLILDLDYLVKSISTT